MEGQPPNYAILHLIVFFFGAIGSDAVGKIFAKGKPEFASDMIRLAFGVLFLFAFLYPMF